MYIKLNFDKYKKYVSYKEEYDEDSYDTIIKVAYPVVMLYYGDENNYSGLSKALEDNNKSEKEYLLNFLNENKDYATECYLEGNEYFSPFDSFKLRIFRKN